MLEVNIPLHSVILLIGESKDFATTTLLPELCQNYTDLNYATTAEYFYPSTMMGDAGFDDVETLLKNIEVRMTFPKQTEFLIVEATASTADFRKEIQRIARQLEYQVVVLVFDDTKKTIAPYISKERYDKVYHLSAKKANWVDMNYHINISNIEEYLTCLVPSKNDYLLVGDVHECLPELKQLLVETGYCVDVNDREEKVIGQKTKKVILIGDFVDKGNRTEETINFLYKYREHFIFVLGNHENFVHKYLIGELPKDAVSENSFNQFFASIIALEKDPILFEKFEVLMKQTRPFIRYIGENNGSFYATHAPCKNKYIGKLSKRGCRKQRNFILNREKAVEPQLLFLKTEANNNNPFHFFGHVATKKAIRVDNQVGLDTGCASGNLLTAATIGTNDEIILYSVTSETHHISAELPILFK